MKRLTLLALAAGCSIAHAGQAAPARAHAPACPSARFPAFFAAWADSAALQKAFTDYPLAHVLLDHATEPAREMKVQLQRNKLSFPLIPARAQRKHEGLALRTDEVDGQHAKVSLFKEETGYRVVYLFRKDACWKLERKEDRSL